MRYFKLKTGASNIYEIERDTFEEKTFRKQPYFSFDDQDIPHQFAVCPHCDNPIQIIGLYKDLKNTDHPYGKHYPHSIEGIANYDQQAYNFCPYAKGSTKVTKDSRKSAFTEYERKLYNLVREQFDRIIYILSSATDISISENLASKMLTNFYLNKGWLYPWASLVNLPWIVGYFSLALPLFGQSIKKGSPLYNSIVENCENAVFIEKEGQANAQLWAKEEKWLNIEFCFMHHKRSIENDRLSETFEFCVREQNGKKENRFYTKTLEVSETYFLNLINLPPHRSHRKMWLVEKAKKIMPDLPNNDIS